MKKTLFLIFIFFILIYLFGIFSRPSIYYSIYIGIPEKVTELRNINLCLPIPYYRGLPIPYYKGSPIQEIVTGFEIAARTRNAKLRLVETKEFGNMMKVFIPKLSRTDLEIGTEKIEFNFLPSFKTGFFFTPLYFFKNPNKIFFLLPHSEKWFWNKEEKSAFFAKRELSTRIYIDKPDGGEILVGMKLRIKRKILFGYILVEQSFETENNKNLLRISENGWRKIKIKSIERKKFF